MCGRDYPAQVSVENHGRFPPEDAEGAGTVQWSEAKADAEVEAVREIVVVPGFCAGDLIDRLPSREMLVGAHRELHEPVVAEALTHTA